jgi:hypothetical protein
MICQQSKSNIKIEKVFCELSSIGSTLYYICRTLMFELRSSHLFITRVKFRATKLLNQRKKFEKINNVRVTLPNRELHRA